VKCLKLNQDKKNQANFKSVLNQNTSCDIKTSGK